MSPIYVLKINRSSDIRKPQMSFYTQGISAQCIHLENVIHWSIEKITLVNGKPCATSLSKHFLAFQRLVKHYSRFLLSLRSLRVLRRLEETGRIPVWRPPPTGALYSTGLLDSVISDGFST